MDNLINVQERRGLRVFVAALILLIAGVLLSMKLGAVPLTWGELYQIITGGDTSKIGQIIMTIRLPRVVVGFLAGMNLALAGVILQGILRNPLADPGIIGITSGGALAAMIIMILMPTYVMLVPIGAFVGALVASFLVYGISWQGGLNPLRLILAGVAVAAFFGGFNTILSVFYPDRVQGTVSWMAGGFVGRSWDDVMMIWPYTAIGIIGITSGGALAAMIIMILMPTYVMLVPIGAFVGALAASFLVYGISWQGGLNPLRLILAGVAVAAFFGGFNTILSVFYPDRVQGTVSWMAGGFVGRSWDDVMMIWPYTAIGIIGSMISIRWLTLLSLGDDTARTLGVHVERCRLSLLVLASLLAASAVSVSGMLGFVGLIVPHVARLIVGVDYRYLIPTSMVFGGILIVYADTLARMMIAPGEIPVGVLMSFLGAPFFLYLLKGVGRR